MIGVKTAPNQPEISIFYAMIQIDGSIGEGGGQVLRTSLALSILTRQELHITLIRHRRSKPGLMAQHLKSVEAAARVCRGSVEGASTGSQELTFRPEEPHSGKYTFEIGTAGSTSLVLQTIFLPLCLAERTSTVTLTGGTHVPWSPCFEYLSLQWLPYLQQMGIRAELTLEQAGFYPPGGGSIRAVIHPTRSISPLSIPARGALQRIQGISAVANLDEDIARRQKIQALRRLEPRCRETKIKATSVPSPVKGTYIVLLAEFAGSRACFSALGARGKPAERVADEAVDGLEEFLTTDGAIDPYLADQLLLPMALAEGISQFRTSRVTQHLLTNAEIIRQFLPVAIDINGEQDQPGDVFVKTK